MPSVSRFVRMSMSAAVLAALDCTEDASLAIETTGVAGLKLSLSIRKKAGQNFSNVAGDALSHIAGFLEPKDLGQLAGVNEAFHEDLQDKVNKLKPEIYFNKNFPDNVLIPVAAKNEPFLEPVGSRKGYLKYFLNSNVKMNQGAFITTTVLYVHDYELIKSENIVNDLTKLGFLYATDLVEVASAGYAERANSALLFNQKVSDPVRTRLTALANAQA